MSDSYLNLKFVEKLPTGYLWLACGRFPIEVSQGSEAVGRNSVRSVKGVQVIELSTVYS